MPIEPHSRRKEFIAYVKQVRAENDAPHVSDDVISQAYDIMNDFIREFLENPQAPDGWCQNCGGKDGEHKSGCEDGSEIL